MDAPARALWATWSTVISDLSSSKKSVGRLLDLNRKILATVLAWTSNPTGTLALEVSNDSTDGVNGTWVPFTATFGKQPTGSADSTTMVAVDIGFGWYRYSWTFASGAGVLSDAANQR